MAKQEKKSETREFSDEETKQQELEILQKLYGKKQGKKKYFEIQEKAKRDSERSKNES